MAAERPRIFVVLFEGRTGSSELMARLNSHPSIQAFPEILAPVFQTESDPWAKVEDIFECLANGSPVPTFRASYVKIDRPEYDALPVRGFKTRLNSPADAGWFNRNGVSKSFYSVDARKLLDAMTRHDACAIRLRRRDSLRHAVSWLRAAQLAVQRNNTWNIVKGEDAFGLVDLNPSDLSHTLAWLGLTRQFHDEAYNAYAGPKMSIDYDDLFAGEAEFERLTDFLGVSRQPLRDFHARVTSDDLSRSISNFDAVKEYLEQWGLGRNLEC